MSHFEGYRQFCEQARRQRPRVALVLGSGLGELAQRVRILKTVPFTEVPGLERPTVAGHQGLAILGTWAGQDVLVFSGRLHFYEGQPWSSVVAPVHIAHALGARVLLITNSAGGIREDLIAGSLLAVIRHLDCSRPGFWRQTDNSASPYDHVLLGSLQDSARDLGFSLPTGVYAQVTGPCYETPAEIRALKSLGVDAVGMSTAREIQAGFDLGLACLAVSCITNRAAGLGPGRIHHEEVLACSAQSKERFGTLLERFLEHFENIHAASRDCQTKISG